MKNVRQGDSFQRILAVLRAHEADCSCPCHELAICDRCVQRAHAEATTEVRS